MNLKPEKMPVRKKLARLAATRGTPGKSRPARKLFEPEAKPLESGVTPLLTVRRPRRNRGALALLAVFLALASASRAQDSNAVPGQVMVTNVEEVTESQAGIEAGQLLHAPTNGGADTIPSTAVSPGPTTLTATPNQQPSASNNEADRNGHRSGSDRDGRRDRTRSDSSREPGSSPASGSSNAAAASSLVGSKTVESFSAFALIGDRNIFNPNRYRHMPNDTRTKAKVVDSFGLVGIMAYEKGTFLFFDGSASEFKKVLKLSDQIAGYKITEVGSASVKLFKDGKYLDLAVGSQMRREEQGDWVLSNQAQTYAASSSQDSASTSAVSTPSGPPGSADEVLKKLMQRREQE